MTEPLPALPSNMDEPSAPRVAKALTDLSIKKLKPKKDRYRVKDGTTKGLVLLVHSSGARVWQFLARGQDGKPRRLVLGPYVVRTQEIKGDPVIGKPLTLTDARTLAARLWFDRRDGRNVFTKPKQVSAQKTFGTAAREYIDQHARRETRRWRETAQTLGLHYGQDKSGNFVVTIAKDSLADRWQDTPLKEIDGDMVHQVIEEATEEGVPGRKVRTKGPSKARGRALGRTLSAMFGWSLKKKRYLAMNPCAGVDIPGASDRDRYFTEDEIRLLWPAFDAAGDLASRVLRVLLLTGQRFNEIRKMRWTEIEVDEHDNWTLNLSRARMKKKRAHKVPFSSAARDIIKGVTRVDGSPFVFCLSPENPISIGSKQKGLINERVKILDWEFEDSRRTAETHMIEMGIDSDLVERITGHAKKGMRRIYDRSERLPERRAALDLWANRVAEIVEGKRAENVARG